MGVIIWDEARFDAPFTRSKTENSGVKCTFYRQLLKELLLLVKRTPKIRIVYTCDATICRYLTRQRSMESRDLPQRKQKLNSEFF